MRLAAWAAVLIAGIATGTITCAALVVRRSRLIIVGLCATVGASALLGAWLAVWQATPRIDAVVAGLFISLGACIGGYMLGTALVPGLTRPAAEDARFEAPGTDSGRLGVVLLSDAEQEDYDPRTVTATLMRHEEKEAPLPPELAKPLVYTAERSRYTRAGSSPARPAATAVARSLEGELRGRGIDADVTAAFCGGGPSLAHAIARLAQEGHRSIVVALLSVSKTSPFVASLAGLNTRELADAGIRIEATDPLWSSAGLVEMLVARVADAVGAEMSVSGVCLVEPGEPVELEAGNPQAAEQNTYFAERVRAELVSAGIPSSRIRRGWLQWEEPDVSEAGRHLAAVGAQRVVFAPISEPTETLQTLLDLRYVAEGNSADTGTGAVVLGAWGDDPAVARALADGVTAAADRMG